jgi:hypothetical protein
MNFFDFNMFIRLDVVKVNRQIPGLQYITSISGFRIQ